MNKAKATVMLLVLAIAAALFFQQRRLAELRERNVGLERQLESLLRTNVGLSNGLNSSALATEISRDQHNELMRLRSEIGMLRNQKTNAVAQAPPVFNEPAVPKTESVPEPITVPRESWVWSGYDTPENSLKTVMWAMSKGDLQTLLVSMAEESRAAFLEQYKDKTEAEIASLLAEESKAIPALRLDRKKQISDHEVSFTLAYQESDNGAQKTRDEAVLRLVKVGEAWVYSP